MTTAKDTKPAAKKDPLPNDVKIHVADQVAQGRMDPHNWRHVALDIADQFHQDFHDVEAYARKVLNGWVEK